MVRDTQPKIIQVKRLWKGSGKKGGMMSVFLMGCLDTTHNRWVTVTKVHTGHDDYTLEKLQGELSPLMIKISQDSTKIPSWLKCNSGLVPDFVAKDPKNQPVWEITGTEFTKANVHTADGISIRFPRVTKIRSDKNWQTATNLDELRQLFKTSKEKTDVSLLNKLAETAKSDISYEESPKKKFKQSPSKVKTIKSFFNKSPNSKSESLNTSQSSDSSFRKSPKSNESKNELNIDSSTELNKKKRSRRDDLNTSQSSESSESGSPKQKKFKGESLNASLSSATSDKSYQLTLSKERIKKDSIKLLPDDPLPDVFQGYKLGFYPDFISFSEKERRLFERHWVAYGGETVKSVHATDVDFLLHNSSEIKFSKMEKLKTKLSPHTSPLDFYDVPLALCYLQPIVVHDIYQASVYLVQGYPFLVATREPFFFSGYRAVTWSTLLQQVYGPVQSIQYHTLADNSIFESKRACEPPETNQTAAHRHSQSQRGHQRLAGLLARNRIFDEGGSWLMEEELGDGWEMG
ncbi:DNA ligase 3 [Eumeta japonica]|uniref:DNA ligase 3 n=1 Tax=Eumeta variegata TaxID=151549 RepID=A0A4C1TL04_EUMVA|nr:DNA ligase 3 [Eumeta japonica]